MTETLAMRDGTNDIIHIKLRKKIEKRTKGYLWTPSDEISFIPPLVPTIFGDGRALFKVTTINQRPAYWVIRGCSTWKCGDDLEIWFDQEPLSGPDFADLSDEILNEIESQYGRGRCGYSGNNLFLPKKERIKYCQCGECSDRYGTARWPVVDDDCGYAWSRMNWPEGFSTIQNPLSCTGNLLAVSETKAATLRSLNITSILL